MLQRVKRRLARLVALIFYFSFSFQCVQGETMLVDLDIIHTQTQFLEIDFTAKALNQTNIFNLHTRAWVLNK